MLAIFMDRKGDVLCTYPNVDLQRGDRVKLHERIYLIVQKIFNVDTGCYEIIMHESEKTE